MKLLDPKKIQEYQFQHQKVLTRPREVAQDKQITSQLLTQVTKLKELTKNLDGSELTILKRELKTLYELCVRAQIAQGHAQNFQLGNTFVIRLAEQEQLLLRELKEQLADGLEALQSSIIRHDLQRMFSYLGGIVGVVMGEEVFG